MKEQSMDIENEAKKKIALLEAIKNECSIAIAKIKALVSQSEIDSRSKVATSIYDLGLSIRASNALRRAGYEHAEEIEAALAKDPYALTSVRNLGRLSEAEVLSALEKHGFKANQEDRAALAVKRHLKKEKKMSRMETGLSDDALKQMKEDQKIEEG